MRIGNVTDISRFWLYPLGILFTLSSAFVVADPATSSSSTNLNNNNEEVIEPANAIEIADQGKIDLVGAHGEPGEFNDVLEDAHLEYDEGPEGEIAAIIGDGDETGYLLVHPEEKRAPRSSFANMLRLDRRAVNPAFASMLRLDKRAHYNPSFNSMLRLDKRSFNSNNQNFANMLRLDKRAYESNLLRLDKKFSNLLRLDKKVPSARGLDYVPSFLRLDKKSNYNPSSFNSMLRLDKRAPYKNQNFATMLRLDKRANYNPSFAGNMLRLDKKANYNPGFNSMLRLDKRYSPWLRFANLPKRDKKSFKSSLKNFGLLRLDR